MTRSIACAVLLVLFVLGGVVAADTLYLKNGKKFEGTLVSESGGVVKFKTAGGVLEFPKSQVDRVEKGATKADEYKERRAKLKDDDIEGLLALARWCREQKLFGQRKRLLRSILKTCPDHPGARKESGQAWRGGKWVKAKDVTCLEVKPGKTIAIPETRCQVAIPSGWKRENGEKSVTGTGPDNYATAPVIVIELIATTDPAKAFPEKEGWAKPVTATAAGLKGLKSRRDTVEALIGKVEWLAVMTGPEHTVRIRLVCLECESEDYAPALAVAVDSLEFEAPPADFVGKYFQMNLPKPRDKWGVGKNDDNVLVIVHQGNDSTESAVLMILSGAPGEESGVIRKLKESLVQQMKAGGDIEKEEEITLSGEKATLIQGTYLRGGIPLRTVVCLVEHNQRVFLIQFQNHEYGGAKTDHALKTVLDSLLFKK